MRTATLLQLAALLVALLATAGVPATVVLEVPMARFKTDNAVLLPLPTSPPAPAGELASCRVDTAARAVPMWPRYVLSPPPPGLAARAWSILAISIRATRRLVRVCLCA